MHLFSEKLRHDIQMHSGSETAPDRRWCRDAQGTPAGAQTDRGAPTTTEMSVPRWKVPPQRLSEKSSTSVACWCDLIDLWDDMRWHVQDDLLIVISIYLYIFHVDLRCFTRQTYPRTPRFDRYLWPISSYWPTEFRGAASWDVSIFLKLWSFAIIWYHLITIRSLIRTVDQQSICSICYLLKNQFYKSFQLSCPRFLIEVWFVWIEGLCVTVCWLITVVGVCGSLGAPQMKFWSF